jgi:acetylornithine aminotransferase
VGGIMIPTAEFLTKIKELCEKYDAVLILDEVQSGYGRSGYFFAHQEFGIEADIINSKRNGKWFSDWWCFDSSEISGKQWFAGNNFWRKSFGLCSGNCGLDVMKDENLIENAQKMGEYIENEIKDFPHIKTIRRKGLMIGIELDRDCSEVRNSLLYNHHIFTGNSNDKAVLRILPALNIKEETDLFINALKEVLENI